MKSVTGRIQQRLKYLFSLLAVFLSIVGCGPSVPAGYYDNPPAHTNHIGGGAGNVANTGTGTPYTIRGVVATGQCQDGEVTLSNNQTGPSVIQRTKNCGFEFKTYLAPPYKIEVKALVSKIPFVGNSISSRMNLEAVILDTWDAKYDSKVFKPVYVTPETTLISKAYIEHTTKPGSSTIENDPGAMKDVKDTVCAMEGAACTHRDPQTDVNPDNPLDPNDNNLKKLRFGMSGGRVTISDANGNQLATANFLAVLYKFVIGGTLQPGEVITTAQAQQAAQDAAEIAADNFEYPAPSAPKNVVATSPGSKVITVSWDKVTGKKMRYYVYIGKKSGGKLDTYGPFSTSSQEFDAWPEDGVTYSVFVTAQQGQNGLESPDSEQKDVTPQALVLAAPTGVTAVGGDGMVTVRWTPVDRATGYRVYWYTSKPVPTANTRFIDVEGVSSNTVDVPQLNNYTKYYFLVLSTTSRVQSDPLLSSTPEATPGALLAAPTGVTAVGGDGKVTVRWTPVDLATAYRIYYSASSPATTASTTYTDIAGASSNSVTISGFINEATYYFVVQARNDFSQSAASNPEQSATTGVPPAAPTGVTHTDGYRQVTLSWPAVANATSYNIYYRATTSGVTIGGADVQKVTGATSPQTITLAEGATYYFKVTAVNAAERESALSSEVSGTPLSRFTDNGNGTVTYNVPNRDGNTFMIQQQDDGVTRNWLDAKAYCSALSLGGHTDWYFGAGFSGFSLYSALDTHFIPALDPTYFPNPKNEYWDGAVDPATVQFWYGRIFNFLSPYGTSWVGEWSLHYVLCNRIVVGH